MVRLSQMAETINKYLEVHKDKDVTSIGTGSPSMSAEYLIHVHDVYEGPPGDNPYTGSDTILINRNRSPKSHDAAKHEQSENMENRNRPDVMKAYMELASDLSKDDERPAYAKMSILWGALCLLNRIGEIDKSMMKILWADFSRKLLDLV